VHYQRNPVRTIRTAVHGTLNMLDMAREVHARILVASTSEVYGDPKEHPQQEQYWGHVNPIGPRACYDEGKRCAETLLFDEWRRADLPIKVARIFNTYGPRMLENDGRIISNFIVQALKGQPITIYGDGSQSRSFCYIDDLRIGLQLLMESPPEITGPFNLGNPNEQTVKQIAHLIVAQTKSKSAIEYHPLPEDDPKRRQPVISRARDVLGWSPRITLDEGLRATINYFSLRLFTGERLTAPTPARERLTRRSQPKPQANSAVRRGLVR